MAIKKGEVRPMAVQVGMHVVLLGNASQPSVIKQPNNQRRPRHGRQSPLHVRAAAIDVVIQAIMEQVNSIAAAEIGWTNPEASAWFDRSVRVPGHFFITA